MKRGHNFSGVFFCLEGGDGSGKSTQVKRTVRYLRENFKVTECREPGGTSIGEQIRMILLDPKNEEMDLTTEFFLYTAARAQLMPEKVKPALERGDIVVADRLDPSTFAYQMEAGSLKDRASNDLFNAIQNIALRDVRPDLTLIYDVPVEISTRRLNPLLIDRMEGKKREFHEKVRQGYMNYASLHPETTRIISAEGSADEVFEATRREIDSLLEKVGYSH